MFFVNHGLRLSLVFWLSVVWIYFYGILCGISLESAPLLCLQLPTSLWRHKFEYKHCCCCCSSLVSTWNMIIHYTSFKILKGKREKRKRQERTKNGEGKYKETTLTQLYLMQIASDFSFKIFSFSFLFPVCLEWCFLCGKGKIFCMWGDTGFPFAHLLLIFSCLKRSKTFRNIYDMQCWFLTESKSPCGSHKGILNTNKILYTENDA